MILTEIVVFFQDTPPLVNVGTASESLKNKNIQAPSLRYGFLGLGIMARGIVKNLINSNHRVNLWCETPSKVGVIYYLLITARKSKAKVGTGN